MCHQCPVSPGTQRDTGIHWQSATQGGGLGNTVEGWDTLSRAGTHCVGLGHTVEGWDTLWRAGTHCGGLGHKVPATVSESPGPLDSLCTIVVYRNSVNQGVRLSVSIRLCVPRCQHDLVEGSSTRHKTEIPRREWKCADGQNGFRL